MCLYLLVNKRAALRWTFTNLVPFISLDKLSPGDYRLITLTSLMKNNIECIARKEVGVLLVSMDFLIPTQHGFSAG